MRFITLLWIVRGNIHWTCKLLLIHHSSAPNIDWIFHVLLIMQSLGLAHVPNKDKSCHSLIKSSHASCKFWKATFVSRITPPKHGQCHADAPGWDLSMRGSNGYFLHHTDHNCKPPPKDGQHFRFCRGDKRTLPQQPGARGVYPIRRGLGFYAPQPWATPMYFLIKNNRCT